jgi:hypothetical protein
MKITAKRALAVLFAIALMVPAAAIAAETQANFPSFSGTVTEIQPYTDADGGEVGDWWYALAEDADGGQMYFLMTADTYRFNGAEVQAGAELVGFYDPNLPVTMVYPPRHKAEVVAVDLPEGQSVKVDRFDAGLVSSDEQLQLNISDDTEVVLQNGAAFDGELAGRRLAVLYDVETKSIPAQTTPLKVVVMFEKIVPLPAEAVGLSLTVNGEAVDSPEPYVGEDGTVMVPIRAVAERLGFTVGWEDATQSVMLNQSVSLTIGEDNYAYMRTAPVQLGVAPELINDRTFVPLRFFGDVLPVGGAYVLDGVVAVEG